jgi:hypothetical protein
LIANSRQVKNEILTGAYRSPIPMPEVHYSFGQISSKRMKKLEERKAMLG